MADEAARSSASEEYRAAIDAALGGVTEGIACLVRSGADLSKPVPPGEHLAHLSNQATALLFTATAHALRNSSLFALLLREGADVNAVDSAGRTPAVIACQDSNEYTDTLETLLAAGVSPTQPDNAGYGPIHHAAANGHVRYVTQLLDAGVDQHRPAADGSTPLLLAASTGAAAAHGELARRFDRADAGNPFRELDERWWFKRGGFAYGALRLAPEDGAWENIALGNDVEQVAAQVRRHFGSIRGTGTPVVLFRFTGNDQDPSPPNPSTKPGRAMRIEKGHRGRLVCLAPRLPRRLPPNWETPIPYRFVLTEAESTLEPVRAAHALRVQMIHILEVGECGERDLPAIVCSKRGDRWIATP